jgi:hypothetical protein
MADAHDASRSDGFVLRDRGERRTTRFRGDVDRLI